MPTLNWIGKEKVINHHRDVPFRVLEHQYGFKGNAKTGKSNESETPTGSGNKIIHGDNLEALKSLLPEYEGKIKCIYIDPPYNTGNESWVYNDNVNHPKIKKWLGEVVGKEGDDLTRHDKWLCMMYPRLQLLHQLLADDGAIFISIDDNEFAHLRLLMNEIFGIRNFISNIIWNSRKSVSNDAVVSLNHNHTLIYSKNLQLFYSKKSEFKLKMSPEGFSNPDDDPNGIWKADPFDSPGIRPNLTYKIKNPNTGKEYLPPKGRCWRTGPDEYQKFFEEGRIVFGKTGKAKPQLKRYFSDANIKGRTPKSIWDDVGTATNGTREIQDIFGSKIFDTPKPSTFIKQIIELSTDKEAIILDSFAGSGTTAHAVLDLNKEDGGNRKFILVEMEDYANDITAERVKRVANGYGTGNKTVEGTNGSFDFYELGKPLFDENDNLNEEVGLEKIQEYIWFSETRTPASFIEQCSQAEPYLLGKKEDTAYYFIYEKERLTTLDYDALKHIKTKAEQYVIYADNCLLPRSFMSKHNIVFKKIPRDITRF
ncbi:MAG TPA: site-specific DNA-methyltransferase [Flavobacteriaceae bacterium]|nr:site-specific DNA-methyltransferase [Flavobacteriaceae bacterium]